MKFLNDIKSEADAVTARIESLKAENKKIADSLDENDDDLTPLLECQCRQIQINALREYAKAMSDIEHLLH